MDRRAILERVRKPLRRARQTRAGDVVARAVQDFTRDDATIYAAAVTFYLLLSVFPLVVFAVSVLGLLARDPDFQARVVEEVVRQLPSGAGVRIKVQELVRSIARPRSGVFGAVAVVAALWTASGVFGALRRALNNAFDVPMARAFFRGRLRDLLSVLVVIVLAILSTALTAMLAIVRAYSSRWFDGVFSNIGWGLVYLVVPLAISFAVFLTLYRLIPNHTLDWGDLWPGALVAAFGFELAKALFSLYLATFASFDEMYGALGSLVAVLVFFFVVANVTIFGAEIASELAKDHDAQKSTVNPASH